MKIPKQGPVIAIDGPAGTGKSSVTKRLAELLRYVHVDTGALYRSIAWCVLKHADAATAAWTASETFREEAVRITRSAHLEFRFQPTATPPNRVFVNGEDATPYIRTPEVSLASSKVSAIPEVRAALLAVQRRLGCVGRAILEGRDIGTVIFPDADVKFFLTATAEERARRRFRELEEAGQKTPAFEELKRQIIERDDGDTNRKVAPLRRAEDAIEVDTTLLSFDQVVEVMRGHIRAKLGEG